VGAGPRTGTPTTRMRLENPAADHNAPLNGGQANQNHKLYALYYASSIGLLVFPTHSSPEPGRCSCGNATCTSIAKHPITSRGLKDASRYPRQVEYWWSRYPYAGIGGTCHPDNLLAWIDIDPAKGGYNSWSSLVNQLGIAGEVERTVITATGGNGYHVWFCLAKVLRNSADQVAPGIDVRCAGGYVVLPPSTHRSGRRYRFLPGHSPADVPIAPMPKSLENFIAGVSNRVDDGTRPAPPRPQSMPASATEIERAIQFISAEGREEWLTVGMALHREFGPTGRLIWDAWSRSSSKFKKRDQDYTWRKFRSTGNGRGAITLGSVFHLATRAGWKRGGAQ
jgi:Bifunctional DNA primase/polymerase, N-terminal/Primase C terminal 2 (PriCT-2)